jgi:outer membrane protein OmpA-like peptidoglycan-associated protein
MMSLLLLALSSRADATEVGVGGYVGVRLRFRWTHDWAVEAGFGVGTDGYTDPRLELLRFVGDPSSLVEPFGAVGIGLVTRSGEPAHFLADIGLGIDSELFPVIDLRTDARFRLMTLERPTAALVLTAGIQIHNPRERDRDDDGIADRVDACPDLAEDPDGWIDTDGCPEGDDDKDGLVDAADRCPTDPEDGDGFQDDDGCPDGDNDADGQPDATDRCRDEAEDHDSFQDEDGCPDPDNDNDGVPDGSDKCLDEPETANGFRDKDGCPDEVPAEVKKFSGKIEGITFETGKAIIKPTSFTVLDGAVEVLTKFPEVRLEVQGHTDDVGDDAKNLKLSQDRAQAVVDYFVKKGVPAERLVARGYGETKPMVPNDSKANQSLNRRVEFVLVE